VGSATGGSSAGWEIEQTRRNADVGSGSHKNSNIRESWETLAREDTEGANTGKTVENCAGASGGVGTAADARLERQVLALDSSAWSLKSGACRNEDLALRLYREIAEPDGNGAIDSTRWAS
jgi:hypothetical protein